MNIFPRFIAYAFPALAITLSSPVCAQERQAPPVTQTLEAAPPTARPALWKVADADTTIWLFGTVHALPKDVIWLDGKVANAFEGSAELITEIVDSNQGEVAQVMMGRAMLPDGRNLRTLLSPVQRRKFEAAVKGQGLPVNSFDRFKPWYAAVALATMPLLKEGFSADSGVEGVLNERAKVLGQKHTALETMDYQLGLFDALPMAVQKRYLIEVVNELPNLRSEFDKIVTTWRSGNADQLAKLINQGESDPQMREALILGRNRAWATWIKARLDQPGTVFIAVGAGHLAGSGSVQQQLNRRGITVSREQ